MTHRSITEKVVSTRDETKCVAVNCDLCRQPAPRPQEHEAHPDIFDSPWATSHELIESVAVAYSSGTNGPDFGLEGQTISFDVCPACFEGVLVPLFAAAGATPSITEF